MANPILARTLAGPWKGWHSRAQEVGVDPHYFRDCQNVELRGGVIANRGGTQRLLTAPTAGRVHALHDARFRDSSSQVIAAAGAKLQVVGIGGVSVGVPADIFINPPTGTPARTGAPGTCFAMANNRVFSVNGVDLDLKYDGTTAFKLGMLPPGALTVGALVGGGTIVGTRGFRARYLNDDGEWSEGSVEAVATLNNQRVPVTVPASTDPQVTKTQLFSTTTNGGGLWLFVAEAATNGATFIAATACPPDDQLGYALEEFVNDPPLGPLRLIASWPQAGRMLAVSALLPSVLYYSDLGAGFMKPCSWPIENIVLVSYDDGDEIVGVWPMYDSVIIQKTRSTWRLRGLPPDLDLEPIHFDAHRTGIGGWSQQAGTMIDTDLFTPGIDGAYFVARDGDQGFEQNRISRAIDDEWAQLAVAAAPKTHAVFDRMRRQVRLWVAKNPATECDRCFVYQVDASTDGQAAGWTWWDVAATASCVVATAIGDVVWIGLADGNLEVMDAGNEDHWSGATPGNGQAYTFSLEPHFFVLATDSDNLARVRALELGVRADVEGTLILTPRIDLGTDTPGFGLTVTPGPGFVLDTAPPSLPDAGILGETALADPRVQIYRAAIGNVRGQFHTLRIVCADRGAAFGLHHVRWLWQGLGPKARGRVTARQAITPGGMG